MCITLDNFIDGDEYLKLTEAEVKDMVPPIGLAKKIIRMIPKVCVCLHISSFVYVQYMYVLGILYP